MSHAQGYTHVGSTFVPIDTPTFGIYYEIINGQCAPPGEELDDVGQRRDGRDEEDQRRPDAHPARQDHTLPNISTTLTQCHHHTALLSDRFP